MSRWRRSTCDLSTISGTETPLSLFLILSSSNGSRELKNGRGKNPCGEYAGLVIYLRRHIIVRWGFPVIWLCILPYTVQHQYIKNLKPLEIQSTDASVYHNIASQFSSVWVYNSLQTQSSQEDHHLMIMMRLHPSNQGFRHDNNTMLRILKADPRYTQDYLFHINPRIPQEDGTDGCRWHRALPFNICYGTEVNPFKRWWWWDLSCI